jgi:hypothetical protein
VKTKGEVCLNDGKITMMGKSAFFSEGTAGQMKSAPSFAKDDDSTLPKEPNGSKIGLGPKPIWGMSF